ncbi:MAG: radical SAM protein [Firmicutes bacterium]|nr:radical SAM protein [Bacillota bacterium]
MKRKYDFFSHIYVEEGVKNHPLTKNILKKKDSHLIYIDHYKDVFCRKGQNIASQKLSPSLIIAKKEGKLIYEGAPVCQSFGNEYFYYTSLIMNCVYDCEYCYLKGMYPSGNIVIFVNIEDIFAQIDNILKLHPVYISVSYDCDLLACESLTGFVEKWCLFASERKDLTVEIRTKSAVDVRGKFKVTDNIIFAFTLSPNTLYAREHNTPSPLSRIKAASFALEEGFNIRLCFDPLIYFEGFKEEYEALSYSVEENIGFKNIKDISLGTFRISADYMKGLRKAEPYSATVQYPFENKGGVYSYPKAKEEYMLKTVKDILLKYIGEDKIYLWESGYE